MRHFYSLLFMFLLANVAFGQNLLTNTGFESNTSNWNLGVYNGAAGSLTRTTSDSYSGSASGRVSITTAGSGSGSGQFIANGSNIISVENGKTYELKFWAKSNNTRTNALVISVARPSPYLTIGGSTTVSTTSTWTEYVHTFTADADYPQARITILCGSFIETYHFDDFVLEEKITNLQNLLTSNTGYETSTSGWNLSTYSGASGSLSRTTTESHSGAASAKVGVTATNGSIGNAQFIASNNNIIAVTSGKTYELRFWAKSNNSRTNSLKISVDQPSPYINIGGSTTVSTTSTWTEYVHTFTANADYSQARITILCGSFIETYHFDDFILGELTSQAPVASFSSNLTTVEAGGNVTFSDNSTNSPTSWSWVFEGGTPATSTAQNPTVSYTTGGTYDVTLTATNATGSYQTIVPDYVTSISNLLTNPGFESNTNNWNLGVYNGAAGSLTRTTSDSHSGLASGRVSITTAGSGSGSGQFIANGSNIISVENGKIYELKFWAKSNNARTNALVISVARPSPYLNIGGSTTVSTTSTWTEYVHTFTANADYSQARITILCGSFIETYHFDDFVLGELPSQAPQTAYYVSKSGNDSNVGTMLSPFKTIQKAVNVMLPGDETLISPGVYRETVTTVRSGSSSSPIKLKALSGGDVIITATERVTGWTVHNGSIYKAPLNQKAHQLFVFTSSSFYDFSTIPGINPSEVMTEARYPNKGTTSKGLFETPEDGNYTSINRSGNNFTVTGLPPGDYTGANLYGYGNRRWWAGSSLILSNTGNVLTGASNYTGSFLSKSNSGFVSGPLQLLDFQKEWSSNGTDLYFKAAGNANPNTLNVEAKVRGLVVRLDHDFIEIDGVKTFGGAIWVAGNNNVLTNMDMRHAANPVIKRQGHNGFSVPEANPLMGIRIRGNNNIVSNSAQYYTGGEGILLAGNANLIENNLIAFTSYYGHFMHSISVTKDDNIIRGNTIRDGGKEHVRLYPSCKRTKIQYNDMSRNGYVSHDIGNIVAWGNYSEGNEIAYNWIHDNLNSSIAGGNHGIYLDNNNKDVLIHHNVIWNIRGNNIRFNSPQYNIYAYNNTLGKSQENIGNGIFFNPANGVPNELSNCNIKNNYMYRAITFPAQYTIAQANNVRNTNVSVFTNPSFMITSSSPAVNQGAVLAPVTFNGTTTFPSVTNNVTDGTPDAGAYEAGGVQWRPGVNRIEDNISSVNVRSALLSEAPRKEEIFEEIKIFPNPASKVVNIQLPVDLQVHTLEIFDVSGRSVLVKNITDRLSEIQLDVSGFSTGLYFIKTYSNIYSDNVQRLLIN